MGQCVSQVLTDDVPERYKVGQRRVHCQGLPANLMLGCWQQLKPCCVLRVQPAWQPHGLGEGLGAAGGGFRMGAPPAPAAPAYTTTVSAAASWLILILAAVFAIVYPASRSRALRALSAHQHVPLQANVGLGRGEERRVFLPAQDPSPGALPRIDEDQSVQGARYFSGRICPGTQAYSLLAAS